MLKVGLTGSVASGKSAVAEVWRKEGVPVVSADDLAREVVEPGSAGLEEVERALGPDVLTGEGELDRAALRERVFGDEEERRRLEAILHPRIEAKRTRWMRAREEEGAPLAVAEIPLLFETGHEDAFDSVVVVHAGVMERLRRLREDRGISEVEARGIMAAQMAPEEKLRRADFVLENDGTLDDLRTSALELLGRLRSLASEAGGRG